MTDIEAVQRAVDENFDAFQALLPEFVRTHHGKFVLMRDSKAVEFFDSAGDAMIYGRKQYPDHLFSIQQVRKTIVDLGYFSHAVHYDPV